MQRPRALLFFIASVVWAVIPLVAYAQLVPCGTDATGGALSCNLCHVGQLMQNIINFLIGLSISIAAAMFAYAGFLYVTDASNPSRIERAHKIFRNVLIGFLIAVSAWLVVQTILSIVFDKSFWIGGNWNELRCISEQSRFPGENKRLIGTNFGDLLNEILPTGPIPDFDQTFGSGSIGGTRGLSRALAVSYGQCKPNSAFGTNANLMSCICGAESAGVAHIASKTDVMRANGQSFSWGLYQINLTANEIRCPNQPVLNCPSAFKGKNYEATIKDKILYDRCVAAAQNVQCNTSTAQYLLNNTPRGATNWSTYGECTQ